MPWQHNGRFAMNGKVYLLDTNAVIALLQGDADVQQVIDDAQWVGISVITYIEFLAFPQIADEDVALMEQFTSIAEVVGLDLADSGLIAETTTIRRKYGVKLPDAVILATAHTRNATLITRDRALLDIPDYHSRPY